MNGTSGGQLPGRGQHHAEPTRTGLEAEFPRWRITDRTVDRRAWAQLRDDPATAVRGEDLMDLRDEIRQAEALMKWREREARQA
ncbi:MAG TPA: hypothetical protein VMV92_29365 [Streptosporangiaceae bacterium]|nr:hypothetical protein [Streptosporangiaceae bacterium]